MITNTEFEAASDLALVAMALHLDRQCGCSASADVLCGYAQLLVDIIGASDREEELLAA